MCNIESGGNDKRGYFQFPIAAILLIIGLHLTFAFLIYFWFTGLTPYVIEEDRLVENLSAFFYLLAFILALWVLSLYRTWWKFTLFVAIIGLAGFLDELSFGERIFNLDMPEIRGVKVDALHDFVAILYQILKDVFGFYGLVSILLGSIIILAWVYTHQQKFSLKASFGELFDTLHGNLLVIFFFVLLTATIIDLKEDIILLVIVEELFEMISGLILCLCTLSLLKSIKKNKPFRSRSLKRIIEMSGQYYSRSTAPGPC